MDFFKKLVVKPGTKIDLNDISTDETFGWSRKDAEKQTEKNLQLIAELQEKLYAEKKRRLLICLQAMDGGGKDGTVKHVCGAMNPAGTRVKSLKKPTAIELAHHFLWRIKKAIGDAVGEVIILNRSHYEDVGVVRVHNLVPESVWRPRYGEINKYEKELRQGSEEIPEGTSILKFWLHISKDEQWDRLMERVNTPEKHWKVSEADFKERPYWQEYMKAFSEAISETSTKEAPWIIVPADHKWMRDLIISQVIADHLQSLNMKMPEPETSIKEISKKYIGKDGEDITPEFNAAAQVPANGNEPPGQQPKTEKTAHKKGGPHQ